MQGNIYWIIQIAFVIAALMAFRSGKLWPALLFVALAGWTYYSHKTGATFEGIKSKLSDAVDESAQSKYERSLKSNYELNGSFEESKK